MTRNGGRSPIKTHLPAAAQVLAGWLALAGAAAAAQDFDAWLAALRAEAAAQGVSAATLDAALTGLRPLPRVVALDRRQPEFTQTFWDYLERRVPPRRIAEGRRLLEKHRALLDRVYRRYGVPPRYLVAFWGLETDYGRHQGRFPVVGALATLAWDRRRPEFFRAQLLDALRILDAGHVRPEAFLGSWAGATGQLQFLPSVFLDHAVDADGDGRKDVWTSLPDVLHSGARFLADLGWRRGERWGREVRLPPDFDWRLAGLDRPQPLSRWAALGLRRAFGQPLPRGGLEAALVLPQGHRGPAFLVYPNFRVILKWNRSVNYALAVGHLADRLAGLPPLRHGREAEMRPLSRAQVEALQRALARAGYYAGPVDGVVGAATRRAVRAYQLAAGLPADGYPTVALVERLVARSAETAP